MPLKTSSLYWLWITICVLLLPTVLSLVRTVLIKTILTVDKECFFCNRKTTIYIKRNILASKLLEYVYPLFRRYHFSYGCANDEENDTRPIPMPVFTEDGLLKHWFCKNCDSYNVYDDEGNLITPNKQTAQADLYKPPPRYHSLEPQLYLESETRHFCDKCVENQELNRLSLALVSGDDDYEGNPIVQAHLEAQYRRVSERFPVVCSSCSRRIERYITLLNKRLSQRLYNYSLVTKNSSKNTGLKTFIDTVRRCVRAEKYLKYGLTVLTAYFCATGLLLVKNTVESYILMHLNDILSGIFGINALELFPSVNITINKEYRIVTPLAFCVRIIPMFTSLDAWLYYLKTCRCLLKFSKRFAIYSSLRTTVLLLLAAVVIGSGLSLKSKLNHAAFFISYIIFVLAPIYKVVVTLYYVFKSTPLPPNSSHFQDTRTNNSLTPNVDYNYPHIKGSVSSVTSNSGVSWDPVEGWVNKPPSPSTPYPSPDNLRPHYTSSTEHSITLDVKPPLLKSHRSIAEHIATLHIGSPK